MKKLLSVILAVFMFVSILPITVNAETNVSGMEFTKTTENYDGYHIIKGTKAVWDTRFYTLTAIATGVSGSNATFNVNFKNKNVTDAKYEVKIVANDNWDTYDPAKTITFTVDTSKPDILSTSSTSGTQFIKFVVINGSDEDVYGLAYYLKPDYVIYRYNYVVGKNYITLGTYAFASDVRYRVKGANKWEVKSFAKNGKMVLGGLKANTEYEIHVLCKIPYTDIETGRNMYVVDQVCNPFTLTTLLTQKPKVTSVNISKIKYGKKTIPAHWEDHANQPSVWRRAEKLNTASYTVKVKVKNVPKNAKGLVMKLGGSTYYAIGRKKTYTFKVYYQDNKKIKGKKIKAHFAYASNSVGKSPLGIGPAKKATYKIKKGTYKVK